MISLNKGIFKPLAVLFSIIVLPATIACIVLFIFEPRISISIVSIIGIMIYVLMLLVAYKCSRSSKYYIKIKENDVCIKYPNLSKNSECLTLNAHEIVRIEYYRLTSIKAWCMLVNYVGPQCAYMTYFCDGKEVNKHIGYPEYQEISNFCKTHDIGFVVR